MNTPSYSPRLITLPYDDPNPPYEINKDEPYRDKVKIEYCYRKHDENYATKRRGSIATHAMINTRNFITVMGFPGLI